MSRRFYSDFIPKFPVSGGVRMSDHCVALLYGSAGLSNRLSRLSLVQIFLLLITSLSLILEHTLTGERQTALCSEGLA